MTNTTAPATYTIVAAPARGLSRRPVFDIVDAAGKLVLTCESRPAAQRWLATLA